jgi:protein archease
MAGAGREGPQSGPGSRGHRALPHTADVGVQAWAPDLPELFEEAAGALAELAADIAPGTPLRDPEPIELDAADPAGLAFAWLNELIGLGDRSGEALLTTEVERVDAHELRGHPAWRMHGCAWFVPLDGRAVRRRIDVKSATYHRLAVERAGDGWKLTAYLDV